MTRNLGRALIAVAALALAPVAGADELDKTSGERLLDETLGKLGRSFYDKARHVDWSGLGARYRDELRSAASPREAHGLVNRMLGELKTSHLALIEGSVYDRELGAEFSAKRTLRAGLELVELDGKLFVGGIYEDGPAIHAGLATGDEVLELDGVPAVRSSRLEEAGHDPGLPGPPSFVLGVKPGERIKVLARRAAGEPARALELVPAETSLVDAERASIRVVERGGIRIGRIHLWHFQSAEIARILEEALTGKLASADALVLDVRGRGGQGALVDRVIGSFRGSRPRWRKPVVALIDRGTRSAKEVFAWSFRRNQVGKLVGETTAGAVIGCTFTKLFDGSVLLLPIQDVRNMTRGENLEGKGVAPDVAVDVGPLPYRGGRDPIGERGEEAAVERALERARFEYR